MVPFFLRERKNRHLLVIGLDNAGAIDLRTCVINQVFVDRWCGAARHRKTTNT